MVQQTVSEIIKPESPLIVQSLVGRTSLPFYIDCLQSLLHHCQEDISLLVHEDGSLDEKDRGQAQRQLGEKAIFPDFKEAREKTLDYLTGRPNCQAIRRESIWGIEFLDPLFAQPDEPTSFYIDADIVFLRPFSGLFTHSEVKGGAVFMRDIQWDAYCLRPWSLLGTGRRPSIVKGITTALVCWDKQSLDWDYLEWFLAQTKIHRIPEWVLPTAQAGLANRCQAMTVCSKQLPNLYPNARVSKDTIGVHLLSSYRDTWLPKINGLDQEQNSTQAIQARFEPCQPCGFFSYSLNQVRRWTNTRLDRW